MKIISINSEGNIRLSFLFQYQYIQIPIILRDVPWEPAQGRLDFHQEIYLYGQSLSLLLRPFDFCLSLWSTQCVMDDNKKEELYSFLSPLKFEQLTVLNFDGYPSVCWICFLFYLLFTEQHLENIQIWLPSTAQIGKVYFVTVCKQLKNSAYFNLLWSSWLPHWSTQY